MKKVRFLLVAGVLAGTALVSAAPAQADVCIRHPSDPSVACLRNGNFRVDACDRHVDGHKVYARYWQWGVPDYALTAYAPSGGCVHHNVNFYQVQKIAVCVQTEGCSRWIYAWE